MPAALWPRPHGAKASCDSRVFITFNVRDRDVSGPRVKPETGARSAPLRHPRRAFGPQERHRRVFFFFGGEILPPPPAIVNSPVWPLFGGLGVSKSTILTPTGVCIQQLFAGNRQENSLSKKKKKKKRTQQKAGPFSIGLDGVHLGGLL